MKKWKYKVVDLHETDSNGDKLISNKKLIADKLNSLGKYGWEAVGIGGFSSGKEVGYHVILKKKIKK
ncbi:MAG: hypothetical protein CMB56_005825 [Methanobacteriota archaeon]|nr:MAG: hypothetical protein CMB56_005825 [Euryarchaeota archaeon]|tara:strand:+ start:5734 stop:5934 length:201 start_codon:yes stop_codon:yes gene_type:complete